MRSAPCEPRSDAGPRAPVRSVLAALLFVIGIAPEGSLALASGQETPDSGEPPAAGADHALEQGEDDPRLDRADRLLAGGRWEEARTLAALVLQERPDSARAESLLGLALYALQDLEAARVHLRRAADADAGDADARLHLAIVLLQEGDDEAALALLREAMAIDPSNAETSFRLGEVLERSGSLPEAEEAYRRALHEEPDHGGALYRLSQVLRELGRNTEAEIALETHRRLSPSFDRRDALIEALRQKPNDVASRLRLARLYLDLGAVASAVRQAEHAAVLAPRSLVVLDLLAEAREAAGMPAEQRIAIRRTLVDLDPRVPSRVRDLARALAQDGRHDEATRLLAEVLLSTGRGGEGVELLEARRDRDPDDPSRGRPLVAMLARLGRIDEAIEEARRVMALPDAAPEDRRTLADLLSLRPDGVGEARELYESILARHPHDAEANFGMAHLLARQGDRDGSLDRLLRACLLVPERREWRSLLADRLEEAGRHEAASRWRQGAR